MSKTSRRIRSVINHTGIGNTDEKRGGEGFGLRLGGGIWEDTNQRGGKKIHVLTAHMRPPEKSRTGCKGKGY